jgi:hypothetical protein
MSGTSRSETRARADGTTWFDDPLIGEASRAMTVSTGRSQSFSYTL